jgi:hypothetical protein
MSELTRQMTHVKCDRDQCINNENGVCSSPDIEIVWFLHAEHPSCITEQCRGV